LVMLAGFAFQACLIDRSSISPLENQLLTRTLSEPTGMIVP
jgi:hypothetical protein